MSNLDYAHGKQGSDRDGRLLETARSRGPQNTRRTAFGSQSRWTIISPRMSGFSEDGQWWWDGAQWMPSAQVVIPDLPAAGTANAQGLIARRDQFRDASRVGAWPILPAGISLLVGLPFLVSERRFFRAYRQWALDLLSSATAYLLGPGEPLVAGEPSLTTRFLGQNPIPDLSVVVTAAHVLVLQMDQRNGQPRGVAVAAGARDVQVEAPTPVFSQPTIVVRRGTQWWSIQGSSGVMRSELVVSAWKRALTAASRA